MAASAQDNESDYGYDLTAEEEDLIYSFAEGIAPPTQTAAPAVATISGVDDVSTIISHAQGAGLDNDAADVLGVPSRLAGAVVKAGGLLSNHETSDSRLVLPVVDADSPPTPVPVASESESESVHYPDLSRAISEVRDTSLIEISRPGNNGRWTGGDTEAPSPLRRFRTFPKKPLSVSDLTAGAWCEQQYEYVLTRLPGGRKTRTQAMREGSVAHQKLEEEIYTPVTVSVEKKEDAFGLRLWNIVQGLRTLRDTGMTRELEVWGFVDGNVVNGIIDGMNYENPAPGFEEEVRNSQGSQQQPVGEQTSQDSKITDFFASSPSTAASQNDLQVYIWDVKTRAWDSFPGAAQERSTKIQLFLYHGFLSDMAADKLDYMTIFQRYGLNADEPFSDNFMAQIGSLHDEIFAEETLTSARNTPPSQPQGVPGVAPDLIKYRTLRSLLPLLQAEIRHTFPQGAASLGQVVSVEYRLRPRAGDDGDGNSRLIGARTFYVDHAILDLYLSRYMEWWRGLRKSDGVAIEEAYKCRTCEFVDGCEWRMRQDQEMLKKATYGTKTAAK